MAREPDACYNNAGAMTSLQATAEVFWQAFKVLPQGARREFLARLTRNQRLREDLLDLAVIESRRHEKSRPFSEYLSSRRAG